MTIERRRDRRFVTLISQLLPPDRREEFSGDLLEELAARRFRWGPIEGELWLLGQLVRSLPSLVGARFRRGPVSGTGALAATLGSGAFTAYFFGNRQRPRRSWAVTVSVGVHAVLIVATLMAGAWGVEELAGPRVTVSLWSGYPETPLPPTPETPVKRSPRTRSRSTRPPARAVAPVIIPASLSGPAVADFAASAASEPAAAIGDEGAGSGDPCPLGGCADTISPPRSLPPVVGEKACLACTPPQLPPAYQQLGARHEMLVRICVGVDGKASSVSVLRGISESVDAGVKATVAAWRFAPYRVDGRPVPFCYNTRFVFTTM